MICETMAGDNRFEIIAKAKQAILEGTNIDTSEDEMKVLDNFLFRCWQMGWLDKYDDTKAPTDTPTDLIGRRDAIDAVRDFQADEAEYHYYKHYAEEAIKSLPLRLTEYKTFCGVPMEEAMKVMQEYNAEPKTDDESELKFYYVESINDYWVGRRLDNFYYADWHEGLGFVWSHSRYLPWGEHIVDENTLWKEHTYPSEPIEIPFTEWIVGFVKKYFAEPKTKCIAQIRIDRDDIEDLVNEKINEIVDKMEEPKTGEWIKATGMMPPEFHGHHCCSECGAFANMDAPFGNREDLSDYCPNCGKRMIREDYE